MTGAGVLAGAKMASADITSYPGSPETDTNGNPGTNADGCGMATASALNLPDLICDVKET